MKSNFSAISIYNKQKWSLPVADQENWGTVFSVEDKAEAEHLFKRQKIHRLFYKGRGTVAKDANTGVCACL